MKIKCFPRTKSFRKNLTSRALNISDFSIFFIENFLIENKEMLFLTKNNSTNIGDITKIKKKLIWISENLTIKSLEVFF